MDNVCCRLYIRFPTTRKASYTDINLRPATTSATGQGQTVSSRRLRRWRQRSYVSGVFLHQARQPLIKDTTCSSHTNSCRGPSGSSPFPSDQHLSPYIAASPPRLSGKSWRTMSPARLESILAREFPILEHLCPSRPSLHLSRTISHRIRSISAYATPKHITGATSI